MPSTLTEASPVTSPANPKSTGIPPTPRAEIDAAVRDLQNAKRAWIAVPPAERLKLLAEMTKRTLAVADRWAALCTEAEGLTPGHPAWGEEAMVGPYFMLRNLRLLEASVADLAAGRKPRIPGRVRRLADGRASARVFPVDIWDRLFYTGVSAEVWMEKGVTPENLASTQAVAYDDRQDPGAVCLVLGGGNVSGIAPQDALYKLFVENRVVLLKVHQVNEYLGPVLAEIFEPLAQGGFFRIAYGGTPEGAYLASHPDIDELHITGSDKTYDAIVFGTGPEGQARKERDEPINPKPFSSELGNVSPVIVVPGDWSDSDLAYHAENLVTQFTNNAGFNCNATRVILTWAGWPQRERLLAEIRRLLKAADLRKAYYPGAADRFGRFAAAHPEMEQIGSPGPEELPWGFISGVSPANENDLCFKMEAFCGLACETPIEAASPAEFVAAATRFANDKIWGTLNVTLLVHPASRRDAQVGKAVERAIEDLRYGTVAINHWAAIGYGVIVTPWGAYPGHPRNDIRSGTGWVHNTLMFSRIEKTVFSAPFRVLPKPVWFLTHKTANRLTSKLGAFEAAPSVAKLPGIFALALRG